MTTLLVDVGNTRIKWARTRSARIGRQHASGHARWGVREFARNLFPAGHGIERVVVASVAGRSVNQRLAAAVRTQLGKAPEFIASVRRAAGVTTLYADPWRLGVDRFVAAIGAHALAKGRPVCIVSIGTTMTVDLVDRMGRHRGGAIVPAPRLMVASLLQNTDGIRRRARGPAGTGRSLFARSTRDAIEQGGKYAVAALAERAVAEATRLLGTEPLVLVSGGAGRELTRLFRVRHRVVPDLVLRGLSVLAST